MIGHIIIIIQLRVWEAKQKRNKILNISTKYKYKNHVPTPSKVVQLENINPPPPDTMK